MKEILVTKGAVKLVETCAGVRPGENVLIITDFTKTNIARVLAATAYQRGAEVVIATMIPRGGHGEEPPPTIAEAMIKADVIFTPVSNSITHTRSMKRALEAGARGLAMTDFTEEMLIHGGIEADFNEQKIVCQKLASAFTHAKVVRLTSPGGTKLTMRKEDRAGNAMYCLVQKGQLSPVPNVEANFSPIEGSAEGVIVADASIPYIGIGVLHEPVVATVEKGMITKIEGGAQARQLAQDLKSRKDPQVYNIAELGVGLNPKSIMQGIMLEDEGVFGTGHIGIGTNVTLGGNVKAAIHYDLIMWQPTIELDGRTVLEKGLPQV
ncbi:MAG: leucyl aminopeptidase [Deltaproteobacteria bacterium]|nr:leucyl aminopeptidase [Deltaproteobacteria bacterium]